MESRLQPSAFFFATGLPDGRIATISEPSSNHNSHVEYESADDFVLSQETLIDHAFFAGLLTGGANPGDVSSVKVEIYRVFPNDSDVGRTSGPPTFSTDKVPTRVNSPADVEFDSRDSTAGALAFQIGVLNATFTTQMSVSSADKITVKSGGNGPATGEEVGFNVEFPQPFDLPAGHYFFVPQVGLSDQAPVGADFLWLSAPKPIQPPGTPFTPDLQSWMRDDPSLAPDWLRIGTDIIGGTTFNGSFALFGQTVPSTTTGRSGNLANANGAFPNQDALLFNSLSLTNGPDDAGPRETPLPPPNNGALQGQTLLAADQLFAAISDGHVQNGTPNGPPAIRPTGNDAAFIGGSDHAAPQSTLSGDPTFQFGQL
jgi:hypothetical protein